VVRTGQPVQGIAHLKRLLAEHLARAVLAAPVNHLRLRTLDTAPWGGLPTSLLPEDQVKGERLHELVERLGARLGPQNVCVPQSLADHRPEHMQRWRPAQGNLPKPSSAQGILPKPSAAQGNRLKPLEVPGGLPSDALYPAWLLAEPLRLAVRQHVPQHCGPLRRLTRLYRVEAGWWEGGGPALRDYFIAHSEHFGLVWIYRERPASLAQGLDGQGEFHWYLQGLYA
jgi:protein ImuB